ncbi:MAG: cell envelope integrity protein TolA, partial [Polaromonas sp.]|nr:cell envelope integrity protein TolA [Polaromonas sp.]
LIGALAWGINWKHSDPDLSFEAELWSSVPQEVAPKLVEPPPAPPPPPPPPPEPVVKAPPPPPAPDVDIALEREKKRKLELKKKEAELAKAKAEQDKLKELQAKKEKEQKAKEDLAKRKAEEAKKQIEAKKAEEKKTDAKTAEQKKLADAAAEKLRQDNIKRALGLASATGGADAKGTAQKAGGPSASYGGKVRARVKPNIIFTDDISGNPTAEVEVRTTPDGTILPPRLLKSSGNKSWDDAVIKAIIRTETMPKDVDGRVPTPMILEFRPKD